MDLLQPLLLLAAIFLSFYSIKQAVDDSIKATNRLMEKLNVELWQLRPDTFFFLRLGNDGKKRYFRKRIYQHLVASGYIAISDTEGNYFELPDSTPVRIYNAFDR